MLSIDPDSHDAIGFIDRVNLLVRGTLQVLHPPAVHVVQVENWFDSKWLKFSGKVLGALGVAKNDLTVPPFNPNRVLRESRYELANDTARFEISRTTPRLHIQQPSADNLQRRLRIVAPSVACFWYSSGSAQTDRGALMTYFSENAEYLAWYVALARVENSWRVTRRKNISPAELARLEQVGSLAHAS